MMTEIRKKPFFLQLKWSVFLMSGGSILLLLASLVIGGVHLPYKAHAAPANQATQNTTKVTCFGEGCTGLDPYQSGCADTFGTLLATEDSSGLLRVELEYSFICQTKWTQAYWLDQVERPLGANIIRQKGLDGEGNYFRYWTAGGTMWWINTDQVWSPNSKAEGCAYAATFGTGPYPGVCVRQ